MKDENNKWKVNIETMGSVLKPNEMERYSLYSDFTTFQKPGFIETIKLVDDCIRKLQEQGELTGYVKINARIKSTESAIKNDEKDNKVLDDVFGMEILAGNEIALRKIIEELEGKMLTTREKEHNKKNGYKATHKMMTMKREAFEALGLSHISYDTFPIIEFQFKTFEVKENATSGPANHWEYKGQTKEQIQQMYDNDEFTEHNLPILYVVENHRIRILSKQETIKEIYPFLNLHIKEKGEQR